MLPPLPCLSLDLCAAAVAQQESTEVHSRTSGYRLLPLLLLLLLLLLLWTVSFRY